MARFARGRRTTIRRRNRRKYLSKWKRRQIVRPKYNGKIAQPIHYFTRLRTGSGINVGAGDQNIQGVVYFSLNDLTDYTEFTSMYDYYKINAVKISFIPTSNVSIYNGGAYNGTYGSMTANVQPVTSQFIRLFTAIDYNDQSSVPVSDLQQYQNCKWTPITKIHKRYFKPRATLVIDEDANAGSSVGLGEYRGWVSTASNATRWYGVKYAAEGFPVNNTNSYKVFDVEAKFYLSFKSKR